MTVSLSLRFGFCLNLFHLFQLNILSRSDYIEFDDINSFLFSDLWPLIHEMYLHALDS